MRRFLIALGLVAALAGCRSARVAALQQPVTLEGVSYDAAWNAAVETLEAHFPVYTSRKKSGEILTEFEITYGQFEFWRDNSASARDRWENTVQTIRRRAHAQLSRVSDTETSLELVVEKERRDRARQGARFSFATFASIFDPKVNALDRRLREPTSEEWAPLGRDRLMEALLIEEIRRRLGRD